MNTINHYYHYSSDYEYCSSSSSIMITSHFPINYYVMMTHLAPAASHASVVLHQSLLLHGEVSYDVVHQSNTHT